MKKNLIRLCFIFFFAFFIFSCKKYDVVSLNENDSILLAPDIYWAVVKDPYAAFHKDGSWNSVVSGHCRKGEIIQVQGKIISKEGVWYKFENGYLIESAVDIYTNKYRAQNAVKMLK